MFYNVILPFIFKNWRYLAVAAAVLAAGAYAVHIISEAKKAGKQECLNEVQVKELTHVVYVKEKQSQAAANRPKSRNDVIERLQQHIY